MKQAFFDGPFEFGPEEDESGRNPLESGFQKLIEFDDYEAERYFREALQFSEMAPAALLGLAQVNSDDPRRAACFLNECSKLLQDVESEESSWHRFLTESYLESDSAGLVSAWKEAALNSNAPYMAVSLARHIIVSASVGGGIEDGRDILNQLTDVAPMLEQLPLISEQNGELSEPQWLRLLAEELLLSGQTDKGLQILLISIEAELHRLEATGLLMPQASLSLGNSSDRLLRLLESHDKEKSKLIAESLLELPRDPFSVGKRWRRLDRELTPWVVGRTALARIAIQERDWSSLSTLPRGFSSRDKSEWFLWQVIAAAETDSDANLWLAALRRERDGKDLLAGAETYLHWKLEGEWLEEILLPGVPDRHIASSVSETAVTSTPLSLPLDFLEPVQISASPFALPNWQSNEVQLSEYEGSPVLVIFFLGGGCLHCVEQLTAFGPWANQYEEAGIPILAVSTDPVEILTETISGETAPGSAFPIPIVSDEELVVFRQWGVYDAFDERAIHATFLLDANQEIIWMEKGNAPYMHPDFLLHEAKRLLNL